MQALSLAQRAEFIRSKIPSGGLFAEKSWRISPHPFALSAAQVKILERLGPALHRFAQASNLLYRQSVAGKRPEWIARLLDQGKPAHLIEWQRDPRIKNDLPAVIRPDLIITADGFALTELDSVIGGIGLTGWLSETYGALGEPVLGGSDGMRQGFNAIFPEGDVVISEESKTYRPEMEWLVGKARVKQAETYRSNGTPIYRFFEAFDWANWQPLRETWQPGQPMTPPLKPFLEEKLWLALFWSRPLQEFWRQELGEKDRQFLQTIIPYSWVIDPTPLPPHAVIPELGIQDWTEMGKFSQKKRELVIKVSGFSPQSSQSAGVYIGHDLSAEEWQKVIADALAEFPRNSRILQRFINGALLAQDYVDEKNQVVTLNGRVRLCPYYFVAQDKTRLVGILSTLCPPDKKLLHGMEDAILAPAIIREMEAWPLDTS